MTARRALLEVAAASLVVAVLTIAVTWPQARHLSTHTAAHDDAMFSIWRLSWVAHALGTDPARIFDGNIFHPVPQTLTFSDAMLLEGVIATPFFWAGVSPVLIYNLLLLGGMAASGVAMFVLARYLTGAPGPALVAAAIFTAAPYRVEHVMHLELQWAMWIPLAFWAIHRTVDTGKWQGGVLVALFLWLQMLSSVYYGLFLAVACVVLVIVLLPAFPKHALRALPILAAAGLAALALTLPYALPYLRTSQTMSRSASDVAGYSATWWNYLASPSTSAFWWWTEPRFGGAEHSLFPGLVALALACAAFAYRPRAIVVVYALLTLVLVELSLGLNGRLYLWLYRSFDALHGIRAPSRFGLLACGTIAVLAAFGARALQALAAKVSLRAGTLVAASLTMLVAADDATRGLPLGEPPMRRQAATDVYHVIQSLGPGPIIELPLPRLDALPGRDAIYMLWSTTHWLPIVNGNSGYYPAAYSETVVRMENFPDDRSITQLANLGIRYVVVHRAFYDVAEYPSLVEQMKRRQDLRHQGTFSDPLGDCELFTVNR